MVKSKITSYAVVVIACDWLDKENCKVCKYLAMQPNLYNVVMENTEPNTIKVHTLGDTLTKCINALNLSNIAKTLCDACDTTPYAVKEKMSEKTR